MLADYMIGLDKGDPVFAHMFKDVSLLPIPPIAGKPKRLLSQPVLPN